MEITFDHTNQFFFLANKRIEKAADNESRFTFALKKIVRQITKRSDSLNKKIKRDITEIQVKFCSIYPMDYEQKHLRGVIIKDDKGNLSYTKENQLACNIAIADYNDKIALTMVEIEPFLYTEQLPDDLTEDEKEYYSQLVIPIDNGKG